MASDTRLEALKSLNESAGAHADLMGRLESLCRRESELQAELARVMEESSTVEQRLKPYREGIIRAVAFLCGVHRVDSVAWTCGTDPIARYVTHDRTILLTARPEENTPDTMERVVQRCGLIILNEVHIL